MDKLCGSLILSWSPQTSQETHQPGVAGQSAWGAERDLHSGLVTQLGLGRQEVHPLRLAAEQLPSNPGGPLSQHLYTLGQKLPHAASGWPSKATK